MLLKFWIKYITIMGGPSSPTDRPRHCWSLALLRSNQICTVWHCPRWLRTIHTPHEYFCLIYKFLWLREPIAVTVIFYRPSSHPTADLLRHEAESGPQSIVRVPSQGWALWSHGRVDSIEISWGNLPHHESQPVGSIGRRKQRCRSALMAHERGKA
jgi:hypothetical protein